MLLGIHVLACNEEDVLDRCLRSVQGLADELVVTDTGSSDRTVEIATSYGARVVRHTWTDDFAAARNEGLDAARTIWVLVLDADEQLAARVGRAEIRELLRKSDSDAYRVAVLSQYGNGEGESLTHEAVRLFRADCGFRYTGVIHEQLVLPRSGVMAGVDGRPCGLTLLHDGYLPEAIARKGKAQRNLRLIEKVLRQTPDDAFHLYNKGVTLCQLNKPEDACGAFALAYLVVPAGAPYRPTLVRDWAKALLAEGRADEAAAMLYREVDRYGDYPDVQLLYGDCLMRQHRVVDARSAYEAALEAGRAAGSAAARYVVEAGAGSYRARCGLAQAESALGRADSAQRLFEAAAGEAPRYAPALAGWADSLQAAGKSDEAIRAAMASIVGLEAPEDLALQARVLGGIGAYAAALPLWREAGPLTPEDARAYAACLIGAGYLREARAVLMAAWAAGGPAEELSADAALCSWSLGERAGGAEGEADYPWSEMLLTVDQWLAGTEGAAVEPAFVEQLMRLLNRVLELGLLPLGRRMKQLHNLLEERYAYTLYRNGYTHAAAGLLLQAMAQRQLTQEELRCLGEILYGKQLYGEALALFEQAIEVAAATVTAAAADVETSASSEQLQVGARLGAAACSLSLAMEALLPWVDAQPALGDGWPNADLEHIQSALIRVHGAGWRTPFTGAQRRRAHVFEEEES
ncbi:TPR domain-containing glycosyltransferase [Paenibacillus albus]|uniref:TPR domain-containing glycosyltransferase n=1 Tax=Paenibacillus albus TaxID=2495582 RepID=UPI0013DED733|nr:TPR domain-containing glycosyltransferase [Paenibacillus albus]